MPIELCYQSKQSNHGHHENHENIFCALYSKAFILWCGCADIPLAHLYLYLYLHLHLYLYLCLYLVMRDAGVPVFRWQILQHFDKKLHRDCLCARQNHHSNRAFKFTRFARNLSQTTTTTTRMPTCWCDLFMRFLCMLRLPKSWSLRCFSVSSLLSMMSWSPDSIQIQFKLLDFTIFIFDNLNFSFLSKFFDHSCFLPPGVFIGNAKESVGLPLLSWPLRQKCCCFCLSKLDISTGYLNWKTNFLI